MNGKNQFPLWWKSISKVIKSNFSTVTRTNFRAGFACTGNTLIWLVGIRGKTCLVGTFYREFQPIKWECYLCTRWWASFTANANQSYESVTCARVASTEVCACHRGKNLIFYHRGNWFLPPWILILQWKLIFTAVEIAFTILEIYFYYHRNWFLSPWQLSFTTMVIYFYHSFIYYFYLYNTKQSNNYTIT